MTVIWLNATVGGGKTAVGRALAHMIPASTFLDGDDYAGPSHLPNAIRWHRALSALLTAAARKGAHPALIIAYPLDCFGYARLRAVCGKYRRQCFAINLATPLPIILRGRGDRTLDQAERARARVMRSEGYHRRPFAQATLPNASHPARSTARKIIALTRCSRPHG